MAVSSSRGRSVSVASRTANAGGRGIMALRSGGGAAASTTVAQEQGGGWTNTGAGVGCRSGLTKSTESAFAKTPWTCETKKDFNTTKDR